MQTKTHWSSLLATMGQEVNDNLQNFWGHNGTLPTLKLKFVPFAIIGPKIQADKLWNNQVLT